MLTCSQCGDGFSAKRETAKYCSQLCASRARPSRKSPSTEQRRAWREGRLAQPGYRERVNAAANDRARIIRDYLDKIKMDRGCVDCGYNDHPAALDFDHLRDKEILVSSAKSIAQADREIEKCDVRCSNCHRIVTWERRRNVDE